MYQKEYINKPNEPLEYISQDGYETVVLLEEPGAEYKHKRLDNMQAVTNALKDIAESIMAL